jgi:SNF2 family DNA or RNA helicase
VCGTVEEKVLQLQETKRQLADAIVGAENSLIRELRAEDIALFEGGGFVWG